MSGLARRRELRKSRIRARFPLPIQIMKAAKNEINRLACRNGLDALSNA
jgi:hypothetical protein